jgi:hypothetical protein
MAYVSILDTEMERDGQRAADKETKLKNTKW